MKSKMYLSAIAIISSLVCSGPVFADTCFTNKAVTEVKVHKNYDLSFALDDGRWYEVVVSTQWSSGMAIHKMLMASVLSGAKINGYGDGSDCKNGKITAITLLGYTSTGSAEKSSGTGSKAKKEL
jgi:hypothetical protein